MTQRQAMKFPFPAAQKFVRSRKFCSPAHPPFSKLQAEHQQLWAGREPRGPCGCTPSSLGYPELPTVALKSREHFSYTGEQLSRHSSGGQS